MKGKKISVSAIIPTFNEENNIERAIKSVLWADEIIVIDSFSTDSTLEIAKKYGVRIIQHEYVNSATQKNWIIPQASHEWVFLLDADEYATEGLIDEIDSVIRKQPKETGFWIRRRNYFMGKRVNFSGWQNDKVIRLFRRDHCKYENKHVHAEIITDGNVGQLSQVIMHNTYRSLNHYLAKINWYSTWKAYDKIEKGTTTSIFFNLLIKPPYRFLHDYFFSLGVLDGKVGFIISALNSYSVFLRGIKIWRIKQGEELRKEKR